MSHWDVYYAHIVYMYILSLSTYLFSPWDLGPHITHLCISYNTHIHALCKEDAQ